MKKRYAIVGVSGRSKAYTDRILGDFRDRAEIVALLDRNEARIADFNATHRLSIPGYSDAEFAKMAEETRPDTVIISTTDGTHAAYLESVPFAQ